MDGISIRELTQTGSREADDAEFIDELLADAHRYLAEVASIDSLRAA